MKALSIRQPWADQIFTGEKPIEYRVWSTKHRGPLVICSSKKPDEGGEHLPLGMALGVVELLDITRNAYDEFEWHLKNPRRFKKPFPVKGVVKLFDVPDELCEVEA